MKKSLFLFFIFGALCSITSCSNLQDRIDKQVKSMDGMAQLGTVEYTITKIVKVDDNAFYKIGDRKILFSCRAYMKAGIDLADFTAEDVKLDKKIILSMYNCLNQKYYHSICRWMKQNWSTKA